MSDDKYIAVQELIESAMSSLKTAQNLMRDLTGVSDVSRERIAMRAQSFAGPADGKVVEGIFDGQNMVDGDGQVYPVPANYASKSKLAEGDGMKLTITDEGKFIYKQILPIERRTVVGALIKEDGQYKVLAEGKTYRVLLASVTFYRAEIGDQVTIIVPVGQEAQWGAIEAVIPKHLVESATKAELTAEVKKKRTRAKKQHDGEMMPDVE